MSTALDYLSADYQRCALVVIDFQNDCILPDAPFAVKGSMEVLPALSALCQGMRAAARPIIHIVRGYLADGSNADLCRRDAIEKGLVLFRPETEGADFPSTLKPQNAPPLDWQVLLNGDIQSLGRYDHVIYKPRWGAFYKTPLEEFLHAQRIHTLIVAGCNSPNCPRTTIYEASERDFRLVLAQDAMSRLDARGCEEMANIGVHLATVEEILNALSRTP